MIMMCQCRFINCNKCTTGGGYWSWRWLCICRGNEYVKESLYFRLHFTVNLELLLKKCIRKNQKNNSLLPVKIIQNPNYSVHKWVLLELMHKKTKEYINADRLSDLSVNIFVVLTMCPLLSTLLRFKENTNEVYELACQEVCSLRHVIWL